MIAAGSSGRDKVNTTAFVEDTGKARKVWYDGERSGSGCTWSAQQGITLTVQYKSEETTVASLLSTMRPGFQQDLNKLDFWGQLVG